MSYGQRESGLARTRRGIRYQDLPDSSGRRGKGKNPAVLQREEHRGGAGRTDNEGKEGSLELKKGAYLTDLRGRKLITMTNAHI